MKLAWMIECEEKERGERGAQEVETPISFVNHNTQSSYIYIFFLTLLIK
jgi:hypothetical protein